jgi:CPA1 family monovalent cation:H+ antiporter
MHFERAYVLLFCFATAVAIAVRRFRVPYTVALVAAGLLLGIGGWFEAPPLTKDVLFTVFLPGLLFEAAFHLHRREFWANRRAIIGLAIPGVVGGTVLTGLLVASVTGSATGLQFSSALTFGAIIVATDPIAVSALLKNLAAPRRLAVLVEGESLFNDGTGVVVFGIVASAASGTRPSALSVTLDFLKVAGLGLAIGALIGFSISRLTRRIHDPMIEITLTVIAAYGSFVAAEEAHASGVIATVVAGILCGSDKAASMSAAALIAAESFWEYVAFALNSVVFLLVGLNVRLRDLAKEWFLVLIAFLSVLVARAVVVLAVSIVLHRTTERLPWRWGVLLTWGGLRGALAMVLALSLPESFPDRARITTMTFGVVLLSILVQGLSAARLLKLLGVATPDSR